MPFNLFFLFTVTFLHYPYSCTSCAVVVFTIYYLKRKKYSLRVSVCQQTVYELPMALCVVHLQLEMTYNWKENWDSQFLAYFPVTGPHPTTAIVLDLDFLLHTMPGSLS